jgi:hypothetical protein
LLPLKERNKLEKSFPSPNGLLKYILSVALEAYRTLAGALQIFLLFPLPVASRELSFNKMKKLKLCMLYRISRDLAFLSAENKVVPSTYFSDALKNLAVKLHFCVPAWCYSLLVN